MTDILKGVTAIAFPATQVPSSDPNTLDDYEEGLTGTPFTPGISFGNATTGITYDTQSGQYVKIGRLVSGWFDIILTSKGSATGLMRITGLPFAHGAASRGCYMVPQLISGISGAGPLVGLGEVGVNTMVVYYQSATGTNDFTNSHATNTMRFMAGFAYLSA